jgi:hypothetical protein
MYGLDQPVRWTIVGKADGAGFFGSHDLVVTAGRLDRRLAAA